MRYLMLILLTVLSVACNSGDSSEETDVLPTDITPDMYLDGSPISDIPEDEQEPSLYPVIFDELTNSEFSVVSRISYQVCEYFAVHQNTNVGDDIFDTIIAVESNHFKKFVTQGIYVTAFLKLDKSGGFYSYWQTSAGYYKKTKLSNNWLRFTIDDSTIPHPKHCYVKIGNHGPTANYIQKVMFQDLNDKMWLKGSSEQIPSIVF